MTLDNETHREFLLKALQSASVQGRLPELRRFVAMADEVELAISSAVVSKPLAGEGLHS